jgi:hypothetical protein
MKKYAVLLVFVVLETTVAFCEPLDPKLCAESVSFVKHFGKSIGGEMGLSEVIDLALRDLKPQSGRGIEVYGWDAVFLEKNRCMVFYRYRETGRPPTVFAWLADTEKGDISSLTQLSLRMLKLAKIY